MSSARQVPVLYYANVSIDDVSMRNKLVYDFEAIAHGKNNINMAMTLEALNGKTNQLKLYTSFNELHQDSSYCYGNGTVIAFFHSGNKFKKQSYYEKHLSFEDGFHPQITQQDIVLCIPTVGYPKEIAFICHSNNFFELQRAIIETFYHDFPPSLIYESFPQKTPFHLAQIMKETCLKIYPGKTEYHNLCYNGDLSPSTETPRKPKVGHEPTLESVKNVIQIITDGCNRYRAALKDYATHHPLDQPEMHVKFLRNLALIEEAIMHSLSTCLKTTSHFYQAYPVAADLENVILNSTKNKPIEEEEFAYNEISLTPLRPTNKIGTYTSRGVIQEKLVDINAYPKSHNIPLTETDCLVLGDLHGNIIKLLYFLIHENIVTGLSKEDYDEFLRIFNFFLTLEGVFNQCKSESVEPLVQEAKQELDKFKKILAKMVSTNPDALLPILLVGDTLAERRGHDYLTLIFFAHLRAINIRVEITISNHDSELIRLYENGDLLNYETVTWLPVFRSDIRPRPDSIFGLGALMRYGVVARAEVKCLIEKIYLPLLTGIVFNIAEATKEMTSIKHAPVRLSIIPRLVKELGLPLVAEMVLKTPGSIMMAVDRINEKIKQLLAEKKFTASSPEGSALHDLMWQRITRANEMEEDALPEGCSIEHVHGHDGGGRSSKRISATQTTVDLDNYLGKDNKSHSGLYGIYYIGNNPNFLKLREEALNTPEKVLSYFWKDKANAKVLSTSKNEMEEPAQEYFPNRNGFSL